MKGPSMVIARKRGELERETGLVSQLIIGVPIIVLHLLNERKEQMFHLQFIEMLKYTILRKYGYFGGDFGFKVI